MTDRPSGPDPVRTDPVFTTREDVRIFAMLAVPIIAMTVLTMTLIVVFGTH
jgi:hypothetical protein